MGTRYTIEALGDGTVEALAIDDTGVIAGYGETDRGTPYPFVGRTGELVRLRHAGSGGWAYALASSRLVVGAVGRPDGRTVAVAWRDGEQVRLETFRGAAASSAGVNAAGRVVGHWVDAQGRSWPCWWDEQDRLRGLGPEPGAAWDVNQAGLVAGYVGERAGGGSGVVWAERGQQRVEAADESCLLALNTAGLAVGFCGRVPFGSQPLLYRDGETTVLSGPDVPWDWGYATAVNDAGQVLIEGGRHRQPGSWLWSEQGWVDLWAEVVDGVTWESLRVHGLNGAGQIAVAAFGGGRHQAAVLHPTG